jgi:hypothetical protein
VPPPRAPRFIRPCLRQTDNEASWYERACQNSAKFIGSRIVSTRIFKNNYRIIAWSKQIILLFVRLGQHMHPIQKSNPNRRCQI